ncbi:fumarylacetoacetate hydrolase family protein [candidate division CSSED10-310 bacterium]|uniref:Fumarylacetoacetate hydrolase family protein n=1 Tax=candidate division CSSED10-310 bacterium TaxID=2855610 RepID=A0ABV6Z0Z3_UNCC1
MQLTSGHFVVDAHRIFCIGRNYRAHAREMNSEVPSEPVVFMKSPSCLLAVGEDIHFPAHGQELHHEAEVVVLIGKEGRAQTDTEAYSFVAGITLGLDLTLRDVQKKLKQKGLPWEKSKSFEDSAPIGKFSECDAAVNLEALEFYCRVNGAIRQQGNTADLIFPIPTLIVALSKIWILKPGDLIYTGTPAGVGPLKVGDEVSLQSELFGSFTWKIVP